MVLLSLVIIHVRIGFPLAALPYAMYFCFFVTFAHNGQEYTARKAYTRPWCIFTVSHQGQHRTGAESDVYEGLVS